MASVAAETLMLSLQHHSFRNIHSEKLSCNADLVHSEVIFSQLVLLLLQAICPACATFMSTTLLSSNVTTSRCWLDCFVRKFQRHYFFQVSTLATAITCSFAFVCNSSACSGDDCWLPLHRFRLSQGRGNGSQRCKVSRAKLRSWKGCCSVKWGITS